MRALERARTLVDLQHDKGVVNALASGSSSLPITILSSAQQRCYSRPSTASTVTEDNDGDMGSSFSNMSMTDIQNLKSSARCGSRTGCPTWITPAAHPGVLLLLHTEPTRPLSSFAAGRPRRTSVYRCALMLPRTRRYPSRATVQEPRLYCIYRGGRRRRPTARRCRGRFRSGQSSEESGSGVCCKCRAPPRGAAGQAHRQTSRPPARLARPSANPPPRPTATSTFSSSSSSRPHASAPRTRTNGPRSCGSRDAHSMFARVLCSVLFLYINWFTV